MSRYIDLEELEKRINVNIKPETLEEKALIEWCKDECIRQGYAMPTADVVAVVRCRDCKHFVDEDETDMLGLCTCKRIAIAYNGELYPERDFYCPYGERKEENEG